jgi:type IV secretory pathway VirB4 component
MKKKQQKENEGASTLQYVNIESIKDGVVVLKNGSLRSVLLVSSINFDLKSSDEQMAVVGAYQNFLNSLDFPLQIVISSKKLNIRPYLENLKAGEKKQRNELLKIQTAEYRAFIKHLTEITNIMSKSFYIVVPFAPIESETEGVFSKLSTMMNKSQAVVDKRELFETYKNQLWQRVDHVAAALGGTGLHFTALSTDELIELFYNAYNPSVFAQSAIKNIEKTELVRL